LGCFGEIKPIDVRLKSVEKDVKKIRKGIDIIVNCFDKAIIGLSKRTERIEASLGIFPAAE
jgi:hypothetical protein